MDLYLSLFAKLRTPHPAEEGRRLGLCLYRCLSILTSIDVGANLSA
jgi:hypothetical protein